MRLISAHHKFESLGLSHQIILHGQMLFDEGIDFLREFQHLPLGNRIQPTQSGPNNASEKQAGSSVVRGNWQFIL